MASPLRRPAVDPGARCASVDRHGVGQLAAQALYEDIGRDQFCDAEDPERFVLTFAIKGLSGIGIEHIDGGRGHLGGSDGLLAERLAADQRDCRDRASTEREAGKRAALFFSVRRRGADHRELIPEGSRGTEASYSYERMVRCLHKADKFDGAR